MSKDLKQARVRAQEDSRHGDEAAGVWLIMTRWSWLGSVSLHRSTESCGAKKRKAGGEKREER